MSYLNNNFSQYFKCCNARCIVRYHERVNYLMASTGCCNTMTDTWVDVLVRLKRHKIVNATELTLHESLSHVYYLILNIHRIFHFIKFGMYFTCAIAADNCRELHLNSWEYLNIQY